MAVTKAEARDIIRRDKLKKLTSKQEMRYFGTGNNAVGDPASMYPTPDNEEINSQLRLALSHINRECRLGIVNDLTFSVEAQTTNGAYRILLSTLSTVGVELGDVSHIYRLFFEDGSGNTARLLPRNRESLDNGYYREWQDTAPQPIAQGGGTIYWIEGGTLNILPAPGTSGTLHFLAGSGIAFIGDLAILEALPSDYHDVVWNTAAWMVARNQPADQEMMILAQQFEQQVKIGIAQILELKRDSAEEEENFLSPSPTRVARNRTRRPNAGLHEIYWTN